MRPIVVGMSAAADNMGRPSGDDLPFVVDVRLPLTHLMWPRDDRPLAVHRLDHLLRVDLRVGFDRHFLLVATCQTDTRSPSECCHLGVLPTLFRWCVSRRSRRCGADLGGSLFCAPRWQRERNPRLVGPGVEGRPQSQCSRLIVPLLGILCRRIVTRVPGMRIIGSKSLKVGSRNLMQRLPVVGQ